MKPIFSWCKSAIIPAFLLLCSQYVFAGIEVKRLRTEAIKNPIGIDIENPSFSWTLDAGDVRGVRQTAYNISLFTDSELTEQVWNSGKIESEQQLDVQYIGSGLQAHTRYWWTVTVWDNMGNEATSTEEAFFETGLMGTGWNGAVWIQATDNALSTNNEETDQVTHYSVDVDFEIVNLSAGVIFSGSDDSNYFMWQINLEYGYPLLRPHVWNNGTAECLAEIDLTSTIDLGLNETHHLKIEVLNNIAYTYIDDLLVDTRTNPIGGNYTYGILGFREYGSEQAYYDNFVVTDLKNDTVLAEENFSENNQFTAGSLTDGRLLLSGLYAWYSPIEDNDVTNYSVEVDFEISNLSAGIIFAGTGQSYYFMWQINLEYGYPLLRPHIWRGSTVNDAECLAEINLSSLVDVTAGTTYHLRIEVNNATAYTYINDVLVDSRTNPDGGNFTYGVLGIRQDRALYNYNDLEQAYFDNFIVTNLDNNEILIEEDFEENNPFSNGTIIDGRLFVEASYAWYTDQEGEAYDIDMDFLIERQVAGIVFSTYDTDNLHLWSINLHDSSIPILRRHIKVNGSYSSSDTDLSTYFTNAELLGSLHHIKISVRGTTIYTYIDGTLVDTYIDTSGTLINGYLGFRTYHDTSHNEKTYYDNILVTSFNGDEQQVTFSEDFENSGHSFSDGVICSIQGSRMLCVTSTYEESLSMQTELLGGTPLFRRDFNIAGEVKSAKIYATALGVFDLFINGSRVGHMQQDSTTVYDELKPGWTDYTKEINYLTYDVTHLLTEGDNVVGAQVSNGWWGGEIAHDMYGTPSLAFLCRLRIEYEDGTEQNIVSDLDWISSTCGPVVYGDIYNGETYDARRESNWSTLDYNASDWFATALNNEFNGDITAFMCQPVRVRDFLERTPTSITVYEGSNSTGTTYGEINVTKKTTDTNNLTLTTEETAQYDMGQNMVGWIRFTVKGNPGTRLRIKFGEMLNDTGASDRANDGPGGSLYTYNLRTAEATLNYTLRGDENGETFEPSTTFFGFRYCEITTSDNVEIIELSGRVVGTEIEETGTFQTDNDDVNQLFSNILWGQRGNFLSIPTDCPQRDERLGWTADTQIFSRAASYNGDTRAFYHKWMNDMRKSQRADGAYPDIAPFCNFWGYGNAAWADAGIIVPWTVYMMSGDTKILSENYESMTAYMNWLSTLGSDGYNYNGAGTGMGDWLAYVTTDARYVSVCYYAYVARLMTQIAGALSSTQTDNYALDSLAYSELYEQIRNEFQDRYIASDGLLNIATQTSYLLALKLGLMPESSTDAAVSKLRTLIEENNYCLNTGFVGTATLCQTLSSVGLNDLAYDLLLQRQNPSWLYSIDQGATTVWERWDSYTLESGFNKHEWIMNSFNHYAYGVVAEWMYRYAAGIETDNNAPGFKHIILQPTPDTRTQFPDGQEQITHVKATHQSPYGLISSEWQLNSDNRITYSTTIPPGTTATLYLPLIDNTDEILESDTPADKAEGVEIIQKNNGIAVINLQSGSYQFTTTDAETDNVENTNISKLKIAPNPFTDRLQIYCDKGEKKITVTNMNGLSFYDNINNDNILTINTSAWSSGLYIINVKTPNKDYRAKAVKQ